MGDGWVFFMGGTQDKRIFCKSRKFFVERALDVPALFVKRSEMK